MAFIVKGSAGSTGSNPVLDLFTFVSGILTDAYSIRIQIYDYSTDEKKAKYHSGSKGEIQIFPTAPGAFFTLDVNHIVGDPQQPGHKLSTGHYYAPWTPDDSYALGDYLIEWRYKETDLTPEKLYTEEFVLVKQGELLTGLTILEKLKLFMQDILTKNDLTDELEYLEQQYILCLELSCMRFNVVPITTTYAVSTFPLGIQYLLFMGAVGHLLVSTSIEQLRNQLTYTDGNIHVGLKDKHQLYIQFGQKTLQDFDNLTRQVKNQMNNDEAWGESCSPYSYTGYSRYGTGWGWGAA